MPFKSEAQRKWMHANKPKMADRWEKHTPKGKKLPKKVKKTESIITRINAVLEGEFPSHSNVVVPEFDCQLDLVLNRIVGDSNGSS